MPSDLRLTAAQLVTRCNAEDLGFSLTSELDTPLTVVGQSRAVEAIDFGIAIKQQGFNLFVLGPTGSGRSTLTKSLIERQAQREPVPSEFCYVYNFDEPRKPRALKLPPGQAIRFRDHMARLIEELAHAIPAVFESQGYRERKEAIEQDIGQRHEHEVETIIEEASKTGVGVMRTPDGFALAPIRDGAVLGPEQQAQMSPEERRRLEEAAGRVHERLHEAMRHLPQLQREERERLRLLDQEITRTTVQELLGDVRRAFSDMPAVLEHVGRVEGDLIDKAAQLLEAQAQPDGGVAVAIDGALLRDGPFLRRYRVNVLVDHRQQVGAPVMTLDQPTSGNLVGKVEYISQLGILVTDFNLIESGALHRANGGYLIIDARRLLMQPVAWEQLKRILRANEIRIESVAQALDLTVTVSLEPEPVPFSGKVVLIGDTWLYHRLSAFDPELDELFKVAADFESDIERTPEACRGYAALLARVVRQEQLKPAQAGAVARIIDYAARLAEDAGRLSMHMRAVFDVLREASHWAARAQRESIAREDVDCAIERSERRHGRLSERMQAVILEGTLRIETAGRTVGQINGISLMQLTRGSFGVPSRITARVRLGKGEVIDIEREVQMAGPLHSKGVLILGAFLGSRYLFDKPLSLRATLVFEQMYGYVEGDSASLAELLVLLSAIGELPIKQGIAVTGSVDQHGRVQAVGGINEKIEGFFAVCQARTLDGTQGVIIPRANVRHLMLCDPLVRAVEQGQFHVWAVSDVDEALATATELDAGARDDQGRYPVGSANHAIEQRLEAFTRAGLAASKQPETDKPKPAH
jgi:predicted ATP-dependent protease